MTVRDTVTVGRGVARVGVGVALGVDLAGVVAPAAPGRAGTVTTGLPPGAGATEAAEGAGTADVDVLPVAAFRDVGTVHPPSTVTASTPASAARTAAGTDPRPRPPARGDPSGRARGTVAIPGLYPSPAARRGTRLGASRAGGRRAGRIRPPR
ncbi:hypothetical protein GCM10011594_07360 [Nakamurella endophytica]|uniref:Uncharacterized protein n=1 Tax=Nakamurella endophytica TaxID=1748367 RepID=A0A917SMQ7_9ACTN|nr:hypothetical protein GCM10011594_07360 [Nakamurella endophytica]